MLGTMGVSYGAWSDEINITGTIETGTENTVISWGQCWSDDSGIGYINSFPSGLTLGIDVVNAQNDVNYYCDFYIDNIVGMGTLPVKIQGITITPAVAAWPLDGFNGSVTFDDDNKTPDMVIGDQIDPGQKKTGHVHVFLDGASPGENYHFDIVVDVVVWNMYIPPE